MPVSQPPLRMRRIMDAATGRALLLSFTAGMEVGVVEGMADLVGMIDKLTSGTAVTAAIIRSGVGPSLFARHSGLSCGIIVDLLGGTWMTGRPDRREQICSLEHAVRVGADGVLFTIGLGSSDESRQLRLCGEIARQCASWGMPLVVKADTTETDARRQYSATLSGQGARLAYELGADLAVVNYSGDPAAFAEALRGVDIPVLVGGAPNMADDATMLDSMGHAIANGASGVMLNAAMFWDNKPSPALKRLGHAIFTT